MKELVYTVYLTDTAPLIFSSTLLLFPPLSNPYIFYIAYVISVINVKPNPQIIIPPPTILPLPHAP